MSPARRLRAHAVRAAMSALVVLSAAACGKARRSPSPVGTLAKPIDQYSGAELHDFVQHLHWTGGHDRQRRCAGDTACAGERPARTTLVHIDAVDTEDSLTTTSLPADGVIAARLTDRGALEESRYHLKPGGQYEYYFIAYAGDSTGTWRLEELEHGPDGYTRREIGRGVLRGCGHPFVAGARADFKSCATAAGSGQMRLMLQGSDPTLTDPIWFGCAMGCCTGAT